MVRRYYIYVNNQKCRVVEQTGKQAGVLAHQRTFKMVVTFNIAEQREGENNECTSAIGVARYMVGKRAGNVWETGITAW